MQTSCFVLLNVCRMQLKWKLVKMISMYRDERINGMLFNQTIQRLFKTKKLWRERKIIFSSFCKNSIAIESRNSTRNKFHFSLYRSYWISMNAFSRFYSAFCVCWLWSFINCAFCYLIFKKSEREREREREREIWKLSKMFWKRSHVIFMNNISIFFLQSVFMNDYSFFYSILFFFLIYFFYFSSFLFLILLSLFLSLWMFLF